MKLRLALMVSCVGTACGMTQAIAQDCACETTCTPIAAPAPEQVRMIEQTIMVPQVVRQRQRIQVQELQMQERAKVVTVYDQVPEVVNVAVQETVMATETRLQPQTTTRMQAVAREVQTTVNVPVQQIENRTMDRAVTKNQTVRVAKDVTTYQVLRTWVPGQGYVAQRIGEPVTQRVIQDEVRPTACTERCVVPTAVTRMEQRVVKQQVVEYQPVTETVNVPIAVSVPRTQVRQQQVVQYRAVPRQVVEREMVQVPVTVEREIEVPVTQMVPRTVQTFVRASDVPVGVR